MTELDDGYDRSMIPTSDQYDQFFSCMPNLHTVILTGYEFMLHGLNHLEQNASKIKYLKELTVDGYSSHSMRAYYDCTSTSKGNFQCIKLDAPGEIITTRNGERGSVYAFLPEFTFMTSLHVKNDTLTITFFFFITSLLSLTKNYNMSFNHNSSFGSSGSNSYPCNPPDEFLDPPVVCKILLCFMSCAYVQIVLN